MKLSVLLTKNKLMIKSLISIGIILIVFNSCQLTRKNRAHKNYIKGMEVKKIGGFYGLVDTEAAAESALYFTKAIKLLPSYKDARIEHALSLYYSESYSESLEEHNLLQSLYPDESRVLNNRGIVYEKLNDFRSAKRDYLKAIELNPNRYGAFRNLGLLYQDHYQDPDSALTYFRISAALAPENFEAQFSLVIALQLTGNYEESLTQSKITQKLDSTHSGLYNTQGLTKYYLKDFKGAIADFEHSLAIQMPKIYNSSSSNQPYTYNNLANCYHKINDYNNACINWKKAIDAGYVYRAEWLNIYNIKDPQILIEEICGN